MYINDVLIGMCCFLGLVFAFRALVHTAVAVAEHPDPLGLGWDALAAATCAALAYAFYRFDNRKDGQ